MVRIETAKASAAWQRVRRGGVTVMRKDLHCAVILKAHSDLFDTQKKEAKTISSSKQTIDLTNKNMPLASYLSVIMLVRPGLNSLPAFPVFIAQP
jgi:hypothetical protein